MAKLDQKFKKKSAQRFDNEENTFCDRKQHKRTRRDSRQKDDIYALMEAPSAYEQVMHY